MSSPRSLVRLEEVAQFDALIDARSPAEYAEDHLPGAINCPVLDNAQRAEVGTMYVQVSPFEARKFGATLVFENIARHLQQQFRHQPKHWRPLVYCWRGGQRSGAFTWALRQVGWEACQLIGGYKTYRTAVIEALNTLPPRLNFRVVCGPTGSGKTLLLQALAEEGAQVLDLEALACHRGSVLGSLPGTPQPNQKWFETNLRDALQGFDPARPVFVEAESRRIGRIQLPDVLIAAMRASPCVAIEASVPARLEYLLRDYAHFAADPADLQGKLAVLKGMHSSETLQRWHALAAASELGALFEELMAQHYDPLYAKSQGRNFAGLEQAQRLELADLNPPALHAAARSLLD